MLVRVMAVEALGRIRAPRARPALWAALSDPSSLVRRYAASAIGEYGDRRDEKRLLLRLRRERSSSSRLGYFEALFRVGRREYLHELVGLLRHSNYQIRCATANTLADLPLRLPERRRVLAALRAALKSEETIAAASSLRSAIRSFGR